MTEALARYSKRVMSLASKGMRRLSLVSRFCTYKLLSIVGHGTFVRFIVLTRSRTGSNLLLSFLNGHPNVFAEGEIFARLNGQDPLTRLQSAYGRQPRRIKAKGFKIFYYHPLDTKADALWERLAAVENIKVIHLTRQNVLRTLLSRKIAGTKDAWTASRFDSSGPDKKRVVLTVDELHLGFSQTRKWEEAARTRFRTHPLLEVTYEELVRSPVQTFRRIVAFLELAYCEPRTKLRQQNPESLRDLILNYDELREAFTGSPWQEYFND